MFSLILTIIITSRDLLTKKIPLILTPVPSTLKVNASSHIKKEIINNLIFRAKLISSKTIFYKEVDNVKQALISNGFPNYIVDEQIKRIIKNVNQQNKHCTNKQAFIKLFTATKCTTIINQIKKKLKTLIKRNTLPTDSNKKINFIMYYNEFKASDLVINNNSSHSIGALQKN